MSNSILRHNAELEVERPCFATTQLASNSPVLTRV